MTILLNDSVELSDVRWFNINDCELSFALNNDHKYNSIEDIDSLLSSIGICVANYHFNGTDCYGNHWGDATDVLCVIPQVLRGVMDVKVFW